MKKKFISVFIILMALFSAEVYACGEINELKSDIGTVSKIADSKYLITIPEGTKEVTLEGSTDYTWVKDFGPRKVKTDSQVTLKVDGDACGYGIYTYFVEFKELANTIAENEPPQNTVTDGGEESPTNNNQNSDGIVIDSIYGTLPLTKLTIKDVDMEFSPDKHDYKLVVNGKFNSLDIVAESQDPMVTITISDNHKNLKEGENLIRITLMDTNGNFGLYTLNIEKQKLKSSNNFLASLTIANYQLNFDPSITEYRLNIGKEKMLNITPVTQSELSTVEVLDNSNLVNGSKVTVRVTAEDGSTKDYTITVMHVFNIMDYWIYVVIVLMILLLLCVFMAMKKKKNQKKLGPEAIEGNQNTAGVVQEIASQNQSAGSVETTSNLAPTQNTSTTDVALKIIEPTNLDVPEDVQIMEENNPTEVFKL